jgi:glycosyltransferase involved in cell wall biosynthesis
MLRHTPELARHSIVVFHEANGAANEYETIGCTVMIWPEITPIRAQWTLNNLLGIFQRHTVGLVRIIKQLKAVQPELIISNTENLWIGGIASKVLGIPHLQIFHAITIAYRLGNWPKLMKVYLRIMGILGEKVISVSNTLQKALISGGVSQARVVTIPNPITPEQAQNASKRPLPSHLKEMLENCRPVILNVGKISPMKGQDQLIEALPQIHKAYPRFLCLFAGGVGSSSGWDNTVGFSERIKERVRDLHLEENVVFLDEIDFLPALLRSVDIYVQTSRTESFGRVVAEALINGIPVVTFDAGALAEVAGPGAILVKAGDVKGLAEAMLRLVENTGLRKRLVSEGSRHVAQLYDAHRVAQKFIQLVTATVNSHKSSGIVKCAA